MKKRLLRISAEVDDTIEMVSEADAGQLRQLLDSDAKLARLKTMLGENYVSMCLVRLMDAVVGCEPDDFAPHLVSTTTLTLRKKFSL
jgi:hypothetical protein